MTGLVRPIDFRNLSLAEAEDLCNEWVKTEDDRFAMLERLYGEPVALTRSGLVATWTWFVRWHDGGGWKQSLGTPPIWTQPVPEAEPGYDATACVAADGLLAHLGKTASALVPGAEWKVFYDCRRNDQANLQPNLWHPAGGYHLDAINTLLGLVWGVDNEGYPQRRLPHSLALVYDTFTGDDSSFDHAAKEFETGADLVAFMDAGNPLWEIDAEDAGDAGTLRRRFAEFVADREELEDALDERPLVQIGFADEVADLAGGVIDGLVDDLRAADLPGVARVYREDREVITLEPIARKRISVRLVARVVKKRLRARLADYGPLDAD